MHRRRIVMRIIFGFSSYRLRVILGLFEVNLPLMSDKIMKLLFFFLKTQIPYYSSIQ